MSLDNIQLSPVMMQDMYKRSLVDLDTDQQKPAETNTEGWPFLGKNEKSIVLIVNEKDTAFLPENDLNFLMSILGACKVSMGDVALINRFKIPAMNYDGIMQQFSPSKVLFFGVEPADIDFPLQFPHYKLQNYNNQTYLCAPPLSILAAQKEQKILLWGCLKTLFEIN
jgi:hypothetical protein